jgi:hypothetical protein
VGGIRVARSLAASALTSSTVRRGVVMLISAVCTPAFWAIVWRRRRPPPP